LILEQNWKRKEIAVVKKETKQELALTENKKRS
jgi:hypothetical protein